MCNDSKERNRSIVCQSLSFSTHFGSLAYCLKILQNDFGFSVLGMNFLLYCMCNEIHSLYPSQVWFQRYCY